MMNSRIPGVARMAMFGALAIVTLGCGGLTEPSDVAVIPTANGFAIDEWVTFVVRNDGRETIHVDRCGERVLAGLDRRVAGRWENEMATLCVLSFYVPPLALAPGESVTDSVLVRSPGRYRLFVGYGRGDTRILHKAWSGGFTVD